MRTALDEKWKGYAPSEGDEEFRTTVAKIEKCRPEDVFAVAGLTFASGALALRMRETRPA